MIRRPVLTTLSAVLLLAVVISAAAGYWLCWTEPGLQWLASNVQRRLKTVQIGFEGLQGTLAGQIDAKRVHIVHDRADITIEGAHIRTQLGRLILNTVYADRVQLDKVRVVLKRGTKPDNGQPPRFLPLPWLSIASDAVSVGSADVILINGQALPTSRSSLRVKLTSRKLQLRDLNAESEHFSCRGSAEVRARRPTGLGGELICSAQLPQQPRYAGHIKIDGDLARLNFSTDATEPFDATVKGALLDLTGQLRWQAEGTVPAANIKPWQPESTLGSFAVKFSAEGDRRRVNLTSNIAPQSLPTGPVDVVLHGTFAGRTLHADTLELRPVKGILTLAGDISFDGGPPSVELTGRWSQLGWPVAEPVVVSRSGEFTLSGPLPYAYAATGEVSGKQIPVTDFNSTGNIDKERIAFDLLEAVPHLTPTLSAPKGQRGSKTSASPSPSALQGGLVACDERVSRDGHPGLSRSRDCVGKWGRGEVGRIRAQGQVSWKTDQPWRINADITRFNPALINEAFPGDLSFTVAGSGSGFKPTDPWRMELSQLRGKLRGQDLIGRGAASRNRDTWELSNVHVTYGSALLEAQGRYAETSNLTWRVVADDLSKALPEARGKLNFSGSLSGTKKEPKVAATIEGAGLAYENYRIGRISGTAAIDLTDRGASQMQLTAADIGLTTRQLKSLEVGLSGRSTEHELRVKADAPGQTKIAFVAAGGYQKQTWKGEFRQIDIATGPDRVALQAPVPVFASAAQVDVASFCLAGDPQRICGEGHWQAKGPWSGKLDATAVPLRIFAAGMANPSEYTGRLALNAAASAEAGQPWTGHAKATFTDGLFVYTRSSGKKEQFSIGSGTTELTADAQRFSARINLSADDIADIEGNAAAERTGADWKQFPLSGAMRARTRELGFVPILLPEIDRASGDFGAEFSLAGTLGAPQLEGNVTLSKGELDLYAVNLLLRDVGLRVDLKGNTLKLTAHTKAGEGTADVKGELAWTNGAPKGSFELKGQNLLIANVPEARVQASPGITVNIDGRNIEVDGAVRVPYARLAPANLTGAVLASEDEMLVGSVPEDPNKRFHILTGIHLILGDDVRVDSYGLTGRLTGSIAAYTETGEVSTATGELRVVENREGVEGQESKYVAYGRELDIERGRLIFTGGDMSNPGVDIRATKRFPEVLAGVNVRGTLRDPRISFFSDPPLPQTQIASLLVAGRTFDSLQDGSGAGMSREQILAQGGALLAKQLGGQLGIDDVSVESDTGDATSLVLGKYLSPRLYVGYGISLAESINTLKLRYTLGDRWTIKVEAGENRSADVVYAIEK